MSGHEVTTIHAGIAIENKVSAECSCGWKACWFPNTAEGNDALGAAIDDHTRGHEMHTQFCGKWQQVVCECGWTAVPRNPAHPTFSRLIAADRNEHFWAVKNGVNE